MLSEKQFGCSRFLSVFFNCKIKLSKVFAVSKEKNSHQINDNWDTGLDTEE
jgi:hypothetical protein